MPSNYSETYQSAVKNGQSWVAYRLPNEAAILSLGPDAEKQWDSSAENQNGFLFAPFNSNENPLLYIGPGAGAYKTQLPNRPFCAGQEAFLDEINLGLKAIELGHLMKLVPARAEEQYLKFFDPVAHFLNLCVTHTAAFCYIWHSPSTGTWLGASPELLLKQEGTTIHTVALAGTQTNGARTFGNKEQEEQGMVLEYLKQTLGQYLETISISEQRHSGSGHLTHLKNEITGQVKSAAISPLQLANILHPTPAVGGFPKEAAFNWLVQNEPLKRTYYSGFLGLVGEGNAELYVNLRCMQVLGERLFTYAGAGLTAQSVPLAEWEETKEKMKVVLNERIADQ